MLAAIARKVRNMTPTFRVQAPESNAELIRLTRVRLKSLEDEVANVEAEYVTLQQRVSVLKEQHAATTAFLQMLTAETSNNGTGPMLVAPKATVHKGPERSPERVRVKEAMKEFFVARGRKKDPKYMAGIKADLMAAGLPVPPTGSMYALIKEIERELDG